MCMGGGSPATITQPDYNAYNKQFDLQKAAIDQSMSNSTLLMQQELQNSLRDQSDLKTQISEIKAAKAADSAALDEEARRLTALVGPPPPAQVASAPEIGVRERGINTRKGKASLRIGRKTSKGSAKGTGLNIT
jgi:hypothetical protein